MVFKKQKHSVKQYSLPPIGAKNKPFLEKNKLVVAAGCGAAVGILSNWAISKFWDVNLIPQLPYNLGRTKIMVPLASGAILTPLGLLGMKDNPGMQAFVTVAGITLLTVGAINLFDGLNLNLSSAARRPTPQASTMRYQPLRAPCAQSMTLKAVNGNNKPPVGRSGYSGGRVDDGNTFISKSVINA